MFDYSNEDKSVYIQKRYSISNDEYKILEEKYDKLCWFAANKLTYSNKKSEEDLQDYHSDIQIGMFRAGSYYKRQCFLEAVFSYMKYCKLFMEPKEIEELTALKSMWSSHKTRSSFGITQEDQLIILLKKYEGVASKPNGAKIEIPNINTTLKFDRNFEVYCKAIIWNTKKSLGQQISKENADRNNEISLSEWEFLEGGDVQNIIDQGISYSPVYYSNDFQAVKSRLGKMEDKRPLETLEILMDPENHDSVFKKKEGKKDGPKLNVVRKKTNMSYRTINKQLKIIEKIIREELGYDL